MYLTQGLHRAIQRAPARRALTHFDPATAQARHWTFAELGEAAATQAAVLDRWGVRAGDRVALLAPNHDALVLALWACWWLGAVPCPLNTRWSTPELLQALDNSGATGLLVDVSLAALMPPATAPCPVWPLADLLGQRHQHRPRPDSRTGSEALAAILYTGGTTGQAKGVALSHANFWSAAMARGAELNTPPDSVSLLVAPLFHVAGLSRLVGQSVVGGACVTLPQFRAAEVLAAVPALGITDTIVVPTMLQALLDDPAFEAGRQQSLSRIAFGAAPMPPDLLARALAVWPRAEFFQAYGLTETAGAVCINPPATQRSAHPERLGAVGRAGLGAEIRITDPQGQDCPRGAVGEIWVRGPMVTPGYWRNPDATRAAFSEDGWFRTGDAGRMDAEGWLFIVDRIKDMVITGGENVYSGEVEAVLRAHPQVAQAAVVGQPDAHWGEIVVAVVVARPGAVSAAELPEALRAWCRPQLAGYKVPKRVVLVDALPLSAAGKVLKNQLRAELMAGCRS